MYVGQHEVRAHRCRIVSLAFNEPRFGIIIARGEKAIEAGQTLTHKQAKQRMSKWLK